MDDDWRHLKTKLDRVTGAIIDFGTYAGWRVAQVARVNRGYLFWCVTALPLRAELRRTMLRVLAHTIPGTRTTRTGRATAPSPAVPSY